MSAAKNRGYTLVEIMVVVAIIGVLSSIGMVAFKDISRRVNTNACVTNLIQIDSAKSRYFMEQWVSETKQLSFSDLVPDYLKTTPACPDGGTYTIGDLPTPPKCSIAGHEKF